MKSSSSDPPPTTADDDPMIFYFVITILMSRNVIWDLTGSIIGFGIDGKMDEKACWLPLHAHQTQTGCSYYELRACLGLTQSFVKQKTRKVLRKNTNSKNARPLIKRRYSFTYCTLSHVVFLPNPVFKIQFMKYIAYF